MTSVLSLFLAAILAGTAFMTTSCQKEKELTVTEYLDEVMEKTADTRISGPVGQARSKIDPGAVRIDLNFKSTDMLQMLAGTKLPDISYSAVRNGTISRTSLSITQDGKTLDGAITQSGREIAVESGLLDKVYGTDLSKWKENYENSIFADKSGRSP